MANSVSNKKQEERDWTVALLLAFLVPGVERFYLNCVGSGILKILTCCGCGVWALIDVILIATGSTLCGNVRYFNGPDSNKMRGGSVKISDNKTLFKQKCHMDYITSFISVILGTLLLFLVIKPYAEPKMLRNSVTKYSDNWEPGGREETTEIIDPTMGKDKDGNPNKKLASDLLIDFENSLKSEHYNEARRIKKLFKKATLLI